MLNHASPTLNLPLPAARAEARRALAEDVAAYLAKGGTIDQVPIGVSRDNASPLRASMNESRPLRPIKVKAERKRRGRPPEWTPERDQFLADNYGRMNKLELAAKLGISPTRLYDRAAELGLYTRRQGIHSGARKS